MRRIGTDTGTDPSSEEEERAVSEAISYVLVFGLIIVGTTLVVFQAGPALESSEERQIAENSERAMLLVQGTVNEMVRRDAPRRENTVDVQDLTVGVGGTEPTRILIQAESSLDGSVTVADVETVPVYIETTVSTVDQTVAYENGAVVAGPSDSPDRWTMTSTPAWAIRTEDGEARSVFLRTVSTTGDSSVTGQATRARLVFENEGTSTERVNDMTELNITVESPRSGAWESYFQRLSGGVNGTDIDTDDGTVTLTIDEFEDGEGSLSHRTQAVRTEVSSR